MWWWLLSWSGFSLFFLILQETKTCQSQIKVENCLHYYSNQIGCKNCEENHILFSFSLCQPLEIQIPNCDIYSNLNLCNKCFAHFYLSSNECVPIALSQIVANCKHYSSSSQVIFKSVKSAKKTSFWWIIHVEKSKPKIVWNTMIITPVRPVLWKEDSNWILSLASKIANSSILIIVWHLLRNSPFNVAPAPEDILWMEMFVARLISLQIASTCW